MAPVSDLALYGHPFSSYTWKALIPLLAHALPFSFRMVDVQHAEHAAFVAAATPQGKFPVLVDGATVVFEGTAIIEHLATHHLPDAGLLPPDPADAVRARMMDRVFDNYVMSQVQNVVGEYLRDPERPDLRLIAGLRGEHDRSYDWIETWLATYRKPEGVTLIECAAAPALFYADWIHPIPAPMARLRQWRAEFMALPAVARCIDDARPYRSYFPPGAPDRD